jgi:hypothetical protein
MQSTYYKKPEKINWRWFPNAMDLLRANPEKIHWDLLYQNPAIFELDYPKMKESKHELNQAIIAEAWHPNRVRTRT